ncbi:leucyl/phenylalanyl-tRNA--protein transferase, partial [Neptunomonas phycophila]|nr:leucyl/phenylalanyl-tRNA--protein transferase [Neptunomonas phycophila]
MGKLFFGEYMFSLRPNASKVAFIKLARQLNTWGYPLIDCQVHKPNLVSLGAIGISRDEFLLYINSYI